MTTSETETLLTAQEVASILGVSEAWVYRAVRHNEIPCVRLGRYARFRRESIERWLQDSETNPSDTRENVS